MGILQKGNEKEGDDKMNEKEATKFLALVKVAYPMAYRDADADTLKATVKMWARDYVGVPYAIMEIALDNFKKHGKFPPTIAEVNEELKQIYWRAAEDAFISKEFGLPERLEKCKAIMEYTLPFKHIEETMFIDYDRIHGNMLSEGANMITEGTE